MALFIQSANVLVSRVAAWVGAIPQSVALTVSSYSSGVITTSSNPTSLIMVGDFIGTSVISSFAAVIDVTSTTITVDDPDGIWTGVAAGTNILKLPTQSSVEIVSAIQFCELKMRTLELPALRSDPFDSVAPTTITTDSAGLATIPADMNWPILFWQETPNSSLVEGSPGAGMGPWIMYDRVGDREIIRRRMIDQLYVRPFGVPRVIRASFSEVGSKYVFTPNPGANVTMKAYYIKTFPFLFGATGDAARPYVQNNAVLATFPEGYFYGTLESYYDKNKNVAEAQKWAVRMDESYGLIEDQNFKDKWSGGDRHLTSEFQPRDYRYSFK